MLRSAQSTASSTARMSIATLDNGKANALDLAMIETLVAHVDAITDDGALVIEGTEGMFTGGLDLAVLGKGGEAASNLMGAMGRLLVHILEAPQPVVVAADGHGTAAARGGLDGTRDARCADRCRGVGSGQRSGGSRNRHRPRSRYRRPPRSARAAGLCGDQAHGQRAGRRRGALTRRTRSVRFRRTSGTGRSSPEPAARTEHRRRRGRTETGAARPGC
ncbi:MAG: hypothetical protein HRT86_05425 [Ilumatobacteraceae bacterium]|nr:hypothetical protein [Ilumatobacteraceae bacterium]